MYTINLSSLLLTVILFFAGMTNIMQCIINLCDSTGSNGHELKQYGVKTWETVTCAVKRRKLLTSDQFSAISDVIGDIEYSLI